MHGNMPYHGWNCMGIEDLGPDEFQICERCNVQQIRYVHTMHHDDYPNDLECGCICAGRMEGRPSDAKAREALIKNRSRRKARWLSRRWMKSDNGNDYLNVHGFHVTVFKHDEGWKSRMILPSGRTRFGSIVHDTSDHAKLSAFDAMTANALALKGKP